MKRITHTLLGSAFLLALTGCSGHSSTAPTTPSGSSAIPSASESLPSAVSSPSAAPTDAKPTATAPPATESTQDPIQAQIASMTLEEKIGQMILAGFEGDKLPDKETQRMITKDHIGGVILYANNVSDDLKQSISLINALKQMNAAANQVPLFMSLDQEGGKVARLSKTSYASIPANGTVGKTKDAKLAEQMGKLLGDEVLSSGFNVDFAPVLDINSNPKNPVIGTRSFGASADLVTKLGIAEMNGMRKEGVISVVKHFPGHGDTSVDSHMDLPVLRKTTEQLEKLEWIPFREAVKQHADAVMVAHILFPLIDDKAPASFSKIIIGEQLRGKLGYEGVVITDDLTMGAIAKHYDIAQVAVDTVLAGSDILLAGHGYDTESTVYQALLTGVKNGTLSESRINESVTRILTLKQHYHLSDKATAVPKLTELNARIKQWRETVNAAAAKS